MEISERGIDLIKDSEGLRLKAYPDPASGGKPWTIGYGHTRNVRAGMVITKEKADEYLRSDLKWAEEAVNDLVNVPLTQNQFDALVSFTFNLGKTALKKSTLLKVLNQRDYDRVPSELRRYVYAGGKKMKGLVIRRDKEADLWMQQKSHTHMYNIDARGADAGSSARIERSLKQLDEKSRILSFVEKIVYILKKLIKG